MAGGQFLEKKTQPGARAGLPDIRQHFFLGAGEGSSSSCRQQCRQGHRQCSPALPAYQTSPQLSGHASSTPRQQELGGLKTETLMESLDSAEKLDPLGLVLGSKSRARAQHHGGHSGHVLRQDPDPSPVTGFPRQCTWGTWSSVSPGVGRVPDGRALPSPYRTGSKQGTWLCQGPYPWPNPVAKVGQGPCDRGRSGPRFALAFLGTTRMAAPWMPAALEPG